MDGKIAMKFNRAFAWYLKQGTRNMKQNLLNQAYFRPFTHSTSLTIKHEQPPSSSASVTDAPPSQPAPPQLHVSHSSVSPPYHCQDRPSST
jgi:hypothetical protein